VLTPAPGRLAPALVEFLRGRRFVVYAGEFRCLAEDPQT
jgi:hypothetical protein